MNLFMINVLNHKIQLPDEHKNIDIIVWAKFGLRFVSVRLLPFLA